MGAGEPACSETFVPLFPYRLSRVPMCKFFKALVILSYNQTVYSLLGNKRAALYARLLLVRLETNAMGANV
ncbi:hypothetical protein KUIN1_25880 [Pseudomonas sp. KUIN-1]|nr:hypothetical protein KUIN1_25880 [Pseudomonas sp. KUIN-1]SOP99463.1 hypothetical protein CFBP4215_02586 [Pseudomonas syringae pv. syringae]